MRLRPWSSDYSSFIRAFLALAFLGVSILGAWGEPIREIVIDGEFEDWLNIPGVADPQGDNSRAGTDILEFKFTHDQNHLYYYSRHTGPILPDDAETGGQGRYYYLVFLDLDNDISTGYVPGDLDPECYETRSQVGTDLELEFERDWNNALSEYEVQYFYANGGVGTQETGEQEILNGILRFGPGDYEEKAQYKFLGFEIPDDLVTTNDLSKEGFTPGDDVFMVQRFSEDMTESETSVDFRVGLVNENSVPNVRLGQTISIAFACESSPWEPCGDGIEPIRNYVLGSETAPTSTPTASPTATPTPTATPLPRLNLEAAHLPLPSNPVYVTLGDVTGDGFAEIVTAHYDEGQIGILRNDGAGHFPDAPMILATGEWIKPTQITIGDLDNDSDNDLIVVVVDSDRLLAYLNNGEGTFQETPLELNAPVSRPLSSFLGDLNGDGLFDLAVANSESGDLTLLLNGSSGKGLIDGSFTSSRVSTGGELPTYVKGGFLDSGNLSIDLVVPNFASGNVSVLLGNGDGTFQDPQAYGVGVNPRQVALEDMNGDGHKDLVVASEGAPQLHPPLPGSVAVLLNDGTGRFGSAQSRAIGHGPIDVASLDIDGDGDRDVGVVLEGIPSPHGHPPIPGSFTVIYNDLGDFEHSDSFPEIGARPISIAIGALNDSLRDDAVVANQHGNEVGVLTFTDTPQLVRVGDLDRDGDSDFVDMFALGAVYPHRDPIFRDAGDLDGDDLLGVNDVLSFLKSKRSTDQGAKGGSFRSGNREKKVAPEKVDGSGDRNGDGMTDYRDVVRR